MANNIVDLFAVNPHAAFHINGVVNSYTVDFMLDTGAAVSLMDTNTWNTIKGTSSLTPWQSPGLIGVGGTHSELVAQLSYNWNWVENSIM